MVFVFVFASWQERAVSILTPGLILFTPGLGETNWVGGGEQEKEPTRTVSSSMDCYIHVLGNMHSPAPYLCDTLSSWTDDKRQSLIRKGPQPIAYEAPDRVLVSHSFDGCQGATDTERSRYRKLPRWS